MPLYECRANDTPERLARRFSRPAEELLRLNGLGDTRRLTEGLVLTIPGEEPPRRELELLGCCFDPPPLSQRSALKEGMSWWADGGAAAEDGAAAELLLRANWDRDGAWSAEAARSLLGDPMAPQALTGEVKAAGLRGLYLLLGGTYAFDTPALTSRLGALAEALHAEGLYLLLGLALEQTALLPAAAEADRAVLLSPGMAPAGGKPRPNAPLDAAAQQLEQAAALLGPEKLLLGLSEYGTLWIGRRAEPLSAETAVHLAAAAHAHIRYDAQAGESCFCFDAGQGESATVWFPDLRALCDRLRLIDAYGLAGLALQSAARPNPAFRALLRERCVPRVVAL